MAGGLALAPQLPARARPVVHLPGSQRLGQALAAHPGEHEHLAAVVLLGDGRHQSVGIEGDRADELRQVRRRCGGAHDAARSLWKPCSRSAMRSAGVLQPDMQPQERPVGRPRPGRAHGPRIDRQDQALVAAPGGAHAEEAHAVEHGVHRRLGKRLQQDREQARAAGEVAPPQGMAGIVRQGRMEHAVDLGALLQPARQMQRARLVARQPHRQRAQAAQRQIAVVGRRAMTKHVGHRLDLAPVLLLRDDDAEHRVGMADDVLRGRVHHGIDAVPQRLEVQRRAPGVVHHHHGAVGVRGFDDGGNVLHLEGQRPRRLRVDEAGGGPHQAGDVAPGEGIVVGGLDAETGEEAVAGRAHRAVDAVGHQHMVAAAQEAQERRDAGGHARGQRDRAPAAFQRGDRLLEGEGRRRAVAAVGDLREAVLLRLVVGLHGGKQHGRGVIDGRVDDPEILARAVAGVRQQRVVVQLRIVHEAISRGVPAGDWRGL